MLDGEGKIWSVISAFPSSANTSTDDQSTRMCSFSRPFSSFSGAVCTLFAKLGSKLTSPDFVRSTVS